MKTEYTYYQGENARGSWNESKKLLRRYKKWEKLGDKELLELLNRVERLEVDANAHGGSVDLNWHGDMEGNGKAWMILNCDEDDWLKLFINALPRLRQLLTERESSNADISRRADNAHPAAERTQ